MLNKALSTFMKICNGLPIMDIKDGKGFSSVRGCIIRNAESLPIGGAYTATYQEERVLLMKSGVFGYVIITSHLEQMPEGDIDEQIILNCPALYKIGYNSLLTEEALATLIDPDDVANNVASRELLVFE